MPEAEHSRVLLVEDDEDDAVLIQDYLEDADPPTTLHVVGSLEAAVEAMAAGPWDLVLLDLTLPDSRGLDTLNGVLDAGHDFPVVVLTGLDDRQLAARAVRRGAQDYLVKGDFQGPSLQRTMRHAIERWRHLHELAAERASAAARAETAQLQAHVAGPAPTDGVTAHTPALLRAGDSELDALVASYRDVVDAYVDAVRGKRLKPAGPVLEVARRLAAMRVPASYAVHMHLLAVAHLDGGGDPVFVRESKLTLLALLGDLADQYLAALVGRERGGPQT